MKMKFVIIFALLLILCTVPLAVFGSGAGGAGGAGGSGSGGAGGGGGGAGGGGGKRRRWNQTCSWMDFWNFILNTSVQ